MKLAERMVISFCAGVSASTAHTWTTLSGTATIICSQRHGLQIRTRSGGHDYEGLSYVAKFPFVLIDLINLREIKVNVENKTAWVQAGATIGELYYKINEKSPNTWITSRCVAHYGHWWSLQWRWLWIFDA
ncbi:hypothetical protein JHK82_012769 [Glycine max]|nr:hypothetical protein JHK82_012769 [Glycine max]